MSLKALLSRFPWARYSKKLAARIESPRNVGAFTQENAAARGVFLAVGTEGSLDEGSRLVFYWLLDPEDGIIVDARFQLFGPSALIGAADAACDLLVGKNYDQARRITDDLLDAQVRDHVEEPAFPPEVRPYLEEVRQAILQTAEQCLHLPLATGYTAPPVPTDFATHLHEGGYPGWDALPHGEQLALIEEVLNREIRPYIALDAGGVAVVALNPNRELLIAYQGSCTSCYSSVGTTLAYIQQILRARIHPQIAVIPNYDTPPTGLPPR